MNVPILAILKLNPSRLPVPMRTTFAHKIAMGHVSYAHHQDILRNYSVLLGSGYDITVEVFTNSKQLSKIINTWLMFESPLERKLFYDGFRKVGLARYVQPQFRIRDSVCDFAFPSVNLVIECDGYNHDVTKRFTKDRQRDRALRTAGWDVFRFSREEIELSPKQCAMEISEFIIKKRNEKA